MSGAQLRTAFSIAVFFLHPHITSLSPTLKLDTPLHGADISNLSSIITTLKRSDNSFAKSLKTVVFPPPGGEIISVFFMEDLSKIR
jgi:hypothetical protein